MVEQILLCASLGSVLEVLASDFKVDAKRILMFVKYFIQREKLSFRKWMWDVFVILWRKCKIDELLFECQSKNKS